MYISIERKHLGQGENKNSRDFRWFSDISKYFKLYLHTKKIHKYLSRLGRMKETKV